MTAAPKEDRTKTRGPFALPLCSRDASAPKARGEAGEAGELFGPEVEEHLREAAAHVRPVLPAHVAAELG